MQQVIPELEDIARLTVAFGVADDQKGAPEITPPDRVTGPEDPLANIQQEKADLMIRWAAAHPQSTPPDQAQANLADLDSHIMVTKKSRRI